MFLCLTGHADVCVCGCLRLPCTLPLKLGQLRLQMEFVNGLNWCNYGKKEKRPTTRKNKTSCRFVPLQMEFQQNVNT